MILKHLARYILLLTVFIISVGYCFAQNTKQQPNEIVTERPSPEYDSKSWKEFSSKEGRFSVLLPGKPSEKIQTGDSPFGKLDAHLFLLDTFAYYRVLYIDYPASDGIRDVEAYFNGVRDGNLKATNAQLLEEKRDYHLAIPGRFFKTRLPNGIINRVNLYFTRNRGYLVSIAMPEIKGDAKSIEFYESIANKFLNSFKIVPDQISEKDRFGDPVGPKLPSLPTGTGVNIDPEIDPSKRLDISRDGKPMPFAQVNGGILNGKATNLPKPDYPAEAGAAGVSGEVKVMIVFDESGNVIWAKAISGPQLLQAVAEEAASKAKFQPVSIQGKPVKVSGFLLYKFVH